MKKTIEKVNGILCSVENVLMVATFMAILVVMVIQIVLRYLFNNPLVWSEEFCRFGYVWITWIGCAFCEGKGDHITIPIIFDKLPEKIKPVVTRIGEVLVIALLIYLIPKACAFTAKEHRFLSGTMEVPMSVLYASLPAGLILTSLQSVLRLVTSLMTKKGEKTC